MLGLKDTPQIPDHGKVGKMGALYIQKKVVGPSCLNGLPGGRLPVLHQALVPSLVPQKHHKVGALPYSQYSGGR